ncbi:hypothetical protein CK218_22230 [Mesorhizobium sp. WSM3879]|uniref:hypothetical protein n=1 Tax=Mesorhizobium sp. WSM3879 TaxID=2029406 RepID=UPI000BB00956|nr:hypothetical protein [Mesorhizobium sp. WSM3879]PBB79070.1 hypothetical protein CK218_22230 [Mesorhizobium sp. WSM3879]
MGQEDREPDFVIQEAARWLIETPKALRPRPTVVELRARFPLDAQEACAAIALANRIRSGGANDAAA